MDAGAEEEMTIDDARAIVASNAEVHDAFPNGFMLSPDAWQSDSEYLVLIDSGAALDPPLVYVDKSSGQIRLEYGMQISGDPTSGMTPA